MEKIVNEILKAPKVIVLRHIMADPDAIGSQYGLAQLVIEQGQAKQVLIAGDVPSTLKELPPFRNSSLSLSEKLLTESDFEKATVVILDTSTINRVDFGPLDFSVLNKAQKVIKIDHHPVGLDTHGQPKDNYPKHTIRYQDTSASSTSEIISNLFEVNTYDISLMSLPISQYLYTGILGDTGKFSYAISPRTFNTVANLIRGFDMKDFTEINHAMSTTTLEEAKMKGYCYDKMVVDDDTANIIISREDLNKHNWPADDMARFVNLLGTVQGITKWMMCVQEEDLSWRISLRSTGIIVNDLAEEYGGGGHPTASGILLPANSNNMTIIQEIKEKLISKQ
ncbi:DHH family phosphoesterase [Ligilactobacillus equi]|nr:bifunctional oligoribonuclease/PAP phosphatase NrnA [Ligilactobacillus equi]